MSRLVLALIDDNDEKIENFYEIDTDWISEFNESFDKSDISNKKEIYETELTSFLAKNILDTFVETSENQHFKISTIPLQTILVNLLFSK